MTERPVLVVGAGPVGMMTALLLARWQVPTVLLEAEPARPPVGSKSICVQRDVLDIYHRAGVADALTAEGVTWHVGRTFYRGHELFSTTFPDAGRSPYPGFINIGQAAVERHLAAAVAAEPLVDARFGHEVEAVRQDATTVTLTVRTGRGRTDLTGTHAVAADGAHGRVREMLGLSFSGRSYGDRFLIADIRADLPFPAERHFHFDPLWNPGRQVLVHPQPDSVWRIDWQVPDDYQLNADRSTGGLDARIRQITGDRPYDIVWLSVYRFQQRMASRMRVGRVLLAGDAAHVMAPFGARGLNSGVQDAENAAWKIAYDRTGRAGPGLLASYGVERGAAARENLRVTGRTMRFLVPQDAEQWDRRRQVLDACRRDPRRRSDVDSGRLAEPYWYVDSPLTTGPRPADLPWEAGTARPPVAGVLCPDGPVRPVNGARRLRELFGRGMVVLTHSVEPPPVDSVAAYRLDLLDDEGVLVAALGAEPGWCALVRPDGHLAYVCSRADPVALNAAIRRAHGHR